MPDAPDMDLIREFARANSEAAFTELVRRHLNLVYSVARRDTGNDGDAHDVTQAVFIILAQKAGSLSEKTLLTGWLYETTRFVATRLRRTNLRRHAREQGAYMQSTLNEADNAGIWEKLSPHLEDAMSRLATADRNALLLRFYENKSVKEIGAALGWEERAAQKRVTRAIEKLRKIFSKRGVALSATAIAGVVSANSVQAAPVGLVKIISAVAVAKGAAATTSTLTLVKGTLKIMAWTKTQTAIVGVIIVSIATYSVIQHQARVRLHEENELLQQQMAQLQAENTQLSTKHEQTPHLPTPQMKMTNMAATLPAEDSPPTNLWARLKDKDIKLTRAQVEAYLKANGRNAANMLAAFRTSGDPALLKEAMEKFPNDPQVDFEAAIDKNLSPDEQRQWLNTFEKSAPNNGLAYYLSALNYFNSGQIDQGVQELSAASGKSLDDYSVGRIQDDVEAYLAAGYPMADAEEMGGYGILLPQATQMKQLGLDAVDLANAYRQAGDSTSAQAALQMAATLGQNYAAQTSGELDINQLVGISIEKAALQVMDPNSSYGNSGQTVQDQLNDLTQQRQAILDLSQQTSNLYPQMSDQDWIIFFDRLQIFGEQNAQHWIINKYGQQQSGQSL